MALGRCMVPKKRSSIGEGANAIINFFEIGHYKGVKRDKEHRE